MWINEIYADGGIMIEDAGPCRRLIFHKLRGEDRVPVIMLVVPNESLDAIGRLLAAQVALLPDAIGRPLGRG